MKFTSQPDKYLYSNFDSLSPNDRGEIASKLDDADRSLGISKNRLSLLTGWSPSRVTRLTSGKQQLTDEDICTWARAIGYTPEAIITEQDIRAYRLWEKVRSPEDCIRDYMDDKGHRAGVVRYELPLSILTSIGVKPHEYVVRASESFWGVVLRKNSELGISGSFMEFWHADTEARRHEIPKMYVCIDPTDEYYGIIIYLDTNDSGIDIKQERKEYASLLDVPSDERASFKAFDVDGWLPERVSRGEITASIGRVTDIMAEEPGGEGFILQLNRTFEKYVALVWQVDRIDITPEYMREPEEDETLTPYDMYRTISGTADFSEEVKEAVRASNRYKCEIDEKHETFEGADGHPYVEVRPLLPLFNINRYGKQIMKEVNAVCLCPYCSARLIHGTREDRESMYIELYRKHRDALEKAGIDVSLSDMLKENML